MKHAALVPFAYLETWHFTPAYITGYYGFVFGVFYVHVPRVRAWFIITILAACNYAVYSQVWSYLDKKLIVTMIDVGQGDALFLEFPNGKNMLIDTGPSSQMYDAGERTIVPFMKRKGISRIQYVVITHSHDDHIGGARAVLESMDVDTLVMNDRDTSHRRVKEVLEIAGRRNVGVTQKLTGSQIHIEGNTRVYVLSPGRDNLLDENANNSSVVLKLLYGHTSMLLTGDAEVEVERTLIPRYRSFLSSNILKVAHHGSSTSTSEGFLNEVRPRKAIISVGNHNRFRHPSPITLRQLNNHSIEFVRTDKAGAIILENDGNKWTTREWR